jgi:hypothetical protein
LAVLKQASLSRNSSHFISDKTSRPAVNARTSALGRNLDPDTQALSTSPDSELVTMSTLWIPITRRIITDHDKNGTAVFGSDITFSPMNPATEDDSPPVDAISGFRLIHRTES